ncbi:DUF1648 domain-containing protein [Pseudactinotalea sp. HY160]|uniref:DUF1648 domain-containing protein n=1 Tax=Pseudactinotalea sp. HY160 TaxID=2654490 RepID=UPI00128DB395|nr:DUF1648 domain-containing protein [Pseudactinotalea sp. HY160]MPV50737.1 DUF1648 domain-containing protein [Pseudactinotalea sp. HY160]
MSPHDRGITPSATTPARPPLPHRGRAIALGIALPLVLIAASYALVLAWLPDLPDTVALHWGPNGVDRVGSLAELMTLNSVLIGVGVVVMFPLVLLFGRSALTRRMIVGLSAGMLTMFCGLFLVQVAGQRGLTDPYAATTAGGAIALSIGVALALGIVAAALAGADPARPATAPVPAGAARIELTDDARAAWSGQATMRRPGLLAMMGLIPMAVGLAVGVSTSNWWLLLPMAGVAALLLGFLSFTVQVDSAGIVARSSIGLRVLHVPADEVLAASVTQVRPFAEFGGWGIRTNVHGTTGLVTRKGEAIRIERTGGRSAVLTVDDAATAAALLNTVAARARR